MIKLLCWNCHGVSHDNFTAFNSYMKEYHLKVVILVEPKINGDKAEKVCRKLGFEEFCQVDEAVGFSGGIWVLWHPCNVKFKVIEKRNQLLHLEGVFQGDGKFFLSDVYGRTSVADQTALWSDIRRISNSMINPWILAGDCNAMLAPLEKRGGAAFSSNQNHPFIDCNNLCSLSDTRTSGPKFTWYKGPVAKRLDRAIVNDYWQMRYPFTTVQHLSRIYSDHRPPLVHCEDIDCTRRPRPFKFMAPWLGHTSFSTCLQNASSGRESLPAKLVDLADKLKKWNKTTFGDILNASRT